ncbi:hypothetical protein HK105_209532, partial [Polyrhizophydium stewartii]
MSLASLLAELVPVDVDAVLAEGPHAQAVLRALVGEPPMPTDDGNDDGGGGGGKDGGRGSDSLRRQLAKGTGFEEDDARLVVASLFGAAPA